MTIKTRTRRAASAIVNEWRKKQQADGRSITIAQMDELAAQAETVIERCLGQPTTWSEACRQAKATVGQARGRTLDETIGSPKQD